MFDRLQNKLTDWLYPKSVALVRTFHISMPKILLGWVAFASLAALLRLAAPATPFEASLFGIITAASPYVMMILAPVAAVLLGFHLFPKDEIYAQPDTRLALYGRWKKVDSVTAQSIAHFGVTGAMASLLLGMLLNVPVRTMEFLVGVPALGSSAPHWFQGLFGLMLLDVVVMSSLYAFAFVMAFRHVPLFPRFLVAIWCLDVAAQLFIANSVSQMAGTPTQVTEALGILLEGNIKKVMISACLWAPYLLISDRVNLTYRSRVRV